MQRILISFWGGTRHKSCFDFAVPVGQLREADNWIDMPLPDGGHERYDLRRLLEWPGNETKPAKTWFSGHLRPDQPSPMHQPVPTPEGSQ